MQVTHDQKLLVAVGRSRRAIQWQNKEFMWSEFLDKLATTTRTRETAEEYAAMSKNDRDTIKDVGGFVGGYLKNGKRNNASVVNRCLVCLDIDNADPGVYDDLDMTFINAYALYSTHSHTPERMRLRLIIPLSRTVTPDEYAAISRRIADDLTLTRFDPTTFEPTRLMYWQSTPDDGEFVFRHSDAPFLDADAVLATYADWKDASLWPTTQLRGVSGPGKLVIYGYNNTTLSSYITIKGCSAHIMLQNVCLREIRSLVNGTSRNGYLVECQMNHFVELNGCTLDANGTTYDSVYVRSSHVVLINCGLYNALQGLEVYQGTGVVKNCSGSCSWAMVAYGGLIFASGTVPSGSRSSGENGQVFANGVTINYGTAIPTVTPDETTIQYATLTKSWRGSWRSDTLDVIQGVYSDSGYSSSLNWNRGCMWFGNLLSVLSGTTISSATLTLHRKTGSGSGAAKTVYLCAITNTGASGTPSIAANYGALGTIGRGATVTFAIPVAAVQGLANGTYGGLCLYESPYNFGSSTYSNCYMRMSGTDESSYKPYMSVVYSGGIAWG